MPSDVADDREVSRWRALLDDVNEVERARAIVELTKLGTRAAPALSALIAAIEDPEPCVRWTALRGLVTLHEGGLDVGARVPAPTSPSTAWLREQLEARGVPLRAHGRA